MLHAGRLRSALSGARAWAGWRRSLSSITVTLDAKDEASPYRSEVRVGKHRLVADEPVQVGGADLGPNPYDLLLASLGSCTSMTLQMYASRKGLPLEKVSIYLEHSKVYAEDCESCTEDGEDPATWRKRKRAKIDRISRTITLFGKDLSAKDRSNLLRIADMCPVHKTLSTTSVIRTWLQEPAQTAGPRLPVTMRIPSRSKVLGGGSETFKIRRVLPFHRKRTIGPFCFADHFGPIDVTDRARAMDVGPHPHIGVATLTYLFRGALIHRDSTGADQAILPGEVNLMVAGRGAVHSERGQQAVDLIPPREGRRELHGVQCWIALPRELEDCEPTFHHAKAKAIDAHSLLNAADGVLGDQVSGVEATLVVGAIAGEALEDLPTPHPLFLLDLVLPEKASVRIPVPAGQEACAYVVSGAIETDGEGAAVGEGQAAVFGAEHAAGEAFLRSAGGEARVAFFGGEPLGERREMWWNFVSTEKRKIKRAAYDWEFRDWTKFPPVANERNDDSVPMTLFRRTEDGDDSKG